MAENAMSIWYFIGKGHGPVSLLINIVRPTCPTYSEVIFRQNDVLFTNDVLFMSGHFLINQDYDHCTVEDCMSSKKIAIRHDMFWPSEECQ